MKLRAIVILLAGLLTGCVRTSTAASRRHREAAAVDPAPDSGNGTATMHVAIVACGADRLVESLALLRSILLLAPNRGDDLAFHLIHESGDGNDAVWRDRLLDWARPGGDDKGDWRRPRFRYHIYERWLPAAYTGLFAPCACQRLFLHRLLPQSVDRVLYLDADTLLLADLADLWHGRFHTSDGPADRGMGPRVLAAMAAEDEGATEHRYYTATRVDFPFYRQPGRAHGLNSGVMRLDLEWLRAAPWDDELHGYLTRYQLTFHDQDLLNIYFAAHPERLALLPCAWNFRTDHCYLRQHCPGLRLLHGSRRTFHRNDTSASSSVAASRFPVRAFQLVYESFALPPERGLGTCREVLQRLHGLVRAAEGAPVDNACEMAVLSVALYQIPAACQLAPADVTDEL